jgi:carbonic anhydrase/acetyltransferase-like protein (isoleucine patch superfamily)
MPSMIISLGDKTPDVPADVFVAASATLVGDVHLGSGVSVWYSAVVRADLATIEIGERTNIQDGCILHADPAFPLHLGSGVTVGHRAVLHGCTVENGCLIGMGAVVLNGAVVGQGSLVAAGAVVAEGTHVPPGSLVAGVPATVKRPLTEPEAERIRSGTSHYVDLARLHKHATPA